MPTFILQLAAPLEHPYAQYCFTTFHSGKTVPNVYSFHSVQLKIIRFPGFCILSFDPHYENVW